MGLLDRDHAISALTDLFGLSLQANGKVALISGPAGSGKTALMQEFTERAAAAGAIGLTATASHTEHALPLGVIAQLLRHRDLPPQFAERVRKLLDDPLLTAGLDEAGPEIVTPAATRGFEDLLTTFLHISDGTPVVIGVDDVQHADALSMQCIHYLIPRIK